MSSIFGAGKKNSISLFCFEIKVIRGIRREKRVQIIRVKTCREKLEMIRVYNKKDTKSIY